MSKKFSLANPTAPTAESPAVPPSRDEEPAADTDAPEQEQLPEAAAAYGPLEWFAPDPRNHRKYLTDLDDLADRMRKLGQLQPVVAVSATLYRDRFAEAAELITPADARFVVIMGGRRLASAVTGKLGRLMYLVNDALLEFEDYREAALDENWRRQDLTCLDDARLLQEFLEIDGTQQKVAERIGKSQPFVASRLQLLKLVPEAQDAIDMRKIGPDQARKLTKLGPDSQREAVARLLGDAQNITSVIMPAQRPVTRASTEKFIRRYRETGNARELGAVLAQEFDGPSFAELVQAAAEALGDPGALDAVISTLQTARDSAAATAG